MTFVVVVADVLTVALVDGALVTGVVVAGREMTGVVVDACSDWCCLCWSLWLVTGSSLLDW